MSFIEDMLAAHSDPNPQRKFFPLEPGELPHPMIDAPYGTRPETDDELRERLKAYFASKLDRAEMFGAGSRPCASGSGFNHLLEIVEPQLTAGRAKLLPKSRQTFSLRWSSDGTVEVRDPLELREWRRKPV